MKMKLIWTFLLIAGSLNAAVGAEVSLFDGKTFQGWVGDTNGTWKIEGGAITGGSASTRTATGARLTGLDWFLAWTVAGPAGGSPSASNRRMSRRR